MKKYLHTLLLILALFTIPTPAQAQSTTACPLPGDTKTNFDTATGQCYSQSDINYNTGLNTQGGARSCGPVRCPGGPVGTYSDGNTCIVKKADGFCYAGTGPSGFNTPGCSGTTKLNGCPSPMGLKIQLKDTKGATINNQAVTVTVTYEDSATGKSDGQTKKLLVTSDSNGIITLTTAAGISLYSGDHFMLSVSSSQYDFTSSQAGINNNIGNLEMNTPSSCGTQMENGQFNTPCLFTGTATTTLNAIPINSPAPAFPADPTVANAEQSVATSIGTLVVIGGVVFVVNWLLGLGKSPVK
ncbi:MAG TPA: hypothetical protein VLF89_02245 [Candidatus Saccharimonadales bacterium]|nr:hypothetical protein [Candidatus Saccharimonadales bacterium]